MTAITFNTALRVAMGALQGFLGKLLEALDRFAMYRVQRAVPESELRRAEREINRYLRLMRGSTARQVRAKSAAAPSHHTAQSMQVR